MSEDDFRDAGAEQEAVRAAAVDEAVTGADPGPVDEDDLEAAEGLTPSPGVAEHYREMVERGADQQGEGRVP